jgi:hypothetical protein
MDVGFVVSRKLYNDVSFDTRLLALDRLFGLANTSVMEFFKVVRFCQVLVSLVKSIDLG